MVYHQIDTKLILTKLFIAIFIFTFSFTSGFSQDEAAEATEATAVSLYNEGLALLKEKKYTEGYDIMMQALEKAQVDENEQVIGLAQKNGAVAAYSAGNDMLKAKDYENAIVYYTSGTELNPGYSSNFIGLGRVNEAQNEKAKAVEYYLKAAEVASGNENEKKVDEAYARARLVVGKLFASKDYADAIANGSAFLAQNEDPEVYYYVSRCKTEEKDYEGALADAEKAIEVGIATEKLEDKFYVAKGLALESLGRKAEAIEAYKMVKAGDYKEQAEYKIQQLSSK